MSLAALDRRGPANPVRTPADAQPSDRFRPGHVVQVRYTPFARREGADFHTLFGPTPLEAAREILRALALPAAEIACRILAQGDVALLRRMPDDAPEHLLPGKTQPVAFVEGLGAADLAEAFEALGERFPTFN